MFNGINLTGINAPKTRTLGGSTVLPTGPYEPNMPSFDSVNIATDTLPAHNALRGMSQIGVPTPRPAPTMVVDHMAGAGARPSPPGMMNMSEEIPNVRMGREHLDAPVHRFDRELKNYEMRGQGISPDEPIGFRAAHTMEMYGVGSRVDVTNVQIAREETMLDQLPTNHGVPMNFGGNPFTEKGRQYLRPQPAAVSGPSFRVPASTKVEPIMSVPLRPAPPRINMPRIPRVSASPMQMEAKPVSPPVAGADMGIGAHASLLANNSRNMGPLGVSSGRSFGPDGSMTPF